MLSLSLSPQLGIGLFLGNAQEPQAHLLVWILLLVGTHAHVYTCAHTNTHTQTDTHVHTHTYIHTRTHTRLYRLTFLTYDKISMVLEIKQSVYSSQQLYALWFTCLHYKFEIIKPVFQSNKN